jgi:hypothetical protein
MANGMKARRLLLVFATTLGGCDRVDLPSAPSTIDQPIATVAPRPPGVSWPAGPFTADVMLSGVVFEVTPAGPAPIEGAWVYCELCGEETHSWSLTDSSGVYRFTGVWALGGVPTSVWIGKDGFLEPIGLPRPTPPNPSGPGWREVRIDGDTRFDAELVRR